MSIFEQTGDWAKWMKHWVSKHAVPMEALSLWSDGKLVSKGKPWKPCTCTPESRGLSLS